MADIFPLIPNLQEQVDNINNKIDNTALPLGRVFKFNFDTNTFVTRDGKLIEIDNDIEKVEQWISLILRTYKDKFDVYKGTEFYCNIDDMVGKKLNGYYLAEMKREVEEALLKHRQIKTVDNFSITQQGRKWNVEYSISLIDGDSTTDSEVI